MKIYVIIFLLNLGIAAVAAVPSNTQRIVGGSETTITLYPEAVALLSFNYQRCGGLILNDRSVLTAGHCLIGTIVNWWSFRVGSTYANSGGTVHTANSFIVHANYNRWTYDNDIAILRTGYNIQFINNIVRPATIAGASYNLGDNQVVWAVGWGRTSPNGPSSEVLRHVQIWTVNQDVCRTRYATAGHVLTDNMLCSGWLDVGGRDQCQGDSGSPLYHNGIVVGISSWGKSCALAEYPGVNVRISRYTAWIQSNA